MGVDFYCGEKTFGCSYGGWNELRTTIIKSTYDYIEDKFQKDFELYNSIDREEDENYIGDGSVYNLNKLYIHKIFKFLQTSNKTQNVFGLDNTINDFIVITRNLSYMDALIYFDIGGLYSLCNKSDCEGFYSVGNSVDICQLLDLIEPFIQLNNKDIHSYIYNSKSISYGVSVYELFKESRIQNKKITIA